MGETELARKVKGNAELSEAQGCYPNSERLKRKGQEVQRGTD
jgi:hypothetical protein